MSGIEEIMDMPRAAVSQQLARLRHDRLVPCRREVRSIYHSSATAEAA